MSSYLVNEVGGFFVLPLQGFVCSEMRGKELILTAPGAASADEAWVSGSRIGEELIRQLLGDEARVERAVATRESKLEIAFDNGVSIVNPGSDTADAWEVRGPGYVLVVAMPSGGEPAIWDATSEIRTIHLGEPLPAQVKELIQTHGLPWPTGDFEFRGTARGREAIELHPPNAPELNRSDMIRFVLPSERSSGSRAPWWRRGRTRKGEGT